MKNTSHSKRDLQANDHPVSRDDKARADLNPPEALGAVNENQIILGRGYNLVAVEQ